MNNVLGQQLKLDLGKMKNGPAHMLYIQALPVYTAKTLVSLHIGADSPEPSLINDKIPGNTTITHCRPSHGTVRKRHRALSVINLMCQTFLVVQFVSTFKLYFLSFVALCTPTPLPSMDAEVHEALAQA